MLVDYSKIGWKNRIIQRPRTYQETTNSDGSVTHTPAPGTVLQEGTPRSAETMDHMDQGIKDCADAINGLEGDLDGVRTSLGQYDTRIRNNERAITDIQSVDERQSGLLAELTAAHNALAEDVEAMDGAKVEQAIYTATIPTLGWSGNAAPYTLTLTVSGILATDIPLIDLVQSGEWATDEQRRESWAGITRIVTAANQLRLTAAYKPTVALPIQVRCLR